MNLDNEYFYEQMKRPLSNFDIYKIFDNKINIYSYDDLKKYKSISELFKPYDAFFILYETKKNYGHWVCLCRDSDHIYFFDSYGLGPDEQLKYINKKYFPYLSYLLLQSKKILKYNKFRLQDLKDSSGDYLNNKFKNATCGRFCCLFVLLYRYIDIDEFAKIFLGSSVNLDYLITVLTHYI